MADYTANYQFRKPGYGDPVNVENDVDSNMDKIDKFINAAVGAPIDVATAPNGQLFINNSDRIFNIKIDGILIPLSPVIRPVGRVGTVTSTTSPSANIFATETVLALSVTFNALAGKRYIYSMAANLQYNSGSPVDQDATGTLRFRWAAGASITTSSTLLGSIASNVPGVLGGERTITKFIEFFPNTSAQVTIGTTLQATASKGIRMNASSPNKICQAYVRDYG